MLELEVLAGAVLLGNGGGLLLLGVVYCVLVLWCAVVCCMVCVQHHEININSNRMMVLVVDDRWCWM